MKIGLEQINVFVFNAIRLAISASVLAAIAIRGHRGVAMPQGISMWRRIVIFAVCSSGLYQVLFLMGVARTTSGNTALIMATIPMWTALLARVFLGELLKPGAWVGLVIALIGTILVAIQRGDIAAGDKHLWGNLIILIAALTWSAGTVYSRPLLAEISPLRLSAIGSVIALPIHLIAAWGHYENNLPVLESYQIWLILCFSGILSSGLALPMWFYGVRHAGAAHAAVIQNLIPVVAIAAAWFSRGETASADQIIGGSLILSGLFLMRRNRHNTNQ